MAEDEKDDRHGEEVKVRRLSQFAKGFGLAEGLIGAQVVLGDAAIREAGHRMCPINGKEKASE